MSSCLEGKGESGRLGRAERDGLPGRFSYVKLGSALAVLAIAAACAPDATEPIAAPIRVLPHVASQSLVSTVWGTPAIVDAPGTVGQFSSMAVVNGRPAISYIDQTNNSLKYVRANDAAGTSWGTPVTVNPNPFTCCASPTFGYPSLVVVNGKPAIAYSELSLLNLLYVQANDADGTSWGAPVVVDGSANNSGYSPRLIVVNGNPAISYQENPPTRLKYVRAHDANGASWGAPVILDASGATGWDNFIAIVNGNPAVAYYTDFGADLNYVRANDANGSTWGAPLKVYTPGTTGRHSSMVVVGGKPAIAFWDYSTFAMKYVSATDASGSTWGAPQTLDTGIQYGAWPSLAIVGGNPAISYKHSVSGLKYVAANDATGSSWGTPTLVDAGVHKGGWYNPLVVVNGQPAISYWNTATFDLQYVGGSGVPSDLTPPSASPTQSPAANGDGWNNSNVTVSWNWTDNLGGTGIDGANCTTSSTSAGEGNPITLSATCKDLANNTGSVSYPVKVDMTNPTVTYSGNAGSYTVDQTVNITCTPFDALSGIASSTCSDISGAASSFALGSHTYSASASDLAGNSGSGSATFSVILTAGSFDILIASYCGTDTNCVSGLTDKAHAISSAPNANAKAGKLIAFNSQVDSQTGAGKPLTAAEAAVLKQLAALL